MCKEKAKLKSIDLELLKKAKNGDHFAMDKILDENKYLVNAIARKYYLFGGEKEDLIQEGMIGFFKAINSYDESKCDNFVPFAIKIIEREIIDTIRTANTKKNQILNDTILIDDNEILPSDGCPEEDIIESESFKELEDEIYKHLSTFEKSVVDLFLKGYTYQDIAVSMGKSAKSIDNALTRIKGKLKFLKERL